MNRQELTKLLLSANNGKVMIAKSKAGAILGIGDRRLNRMLTGVPYKVVGRNHAHMYLISDIADAYVDM